jgi:hypothetical protein
VALLPLELQAAAVTSKTAAAAPIKYLFLRMSFPNFVAPPTSAGSVDPAGEGRSRPTPAEDWLR